ncbi:MAG: tetratricopeptide repeat protein [Methanomicrobiales archaeon]|nr:tetratricopeptide repeat protein [Methanomicrobiales archaeon]
MLKTVKFDQIIFTAILLAIFVSPALAQNADYWISQGKTLYNQDRLSEAADAYDKAIAIESGNLEALFGKARALTGYDLNLTKSQTTWEKFGKELDRRLAENPNDVQAWVLKGDRMLFFGSYNMSPYDMALSIDPNNVRALVGKGICLSGAAKISVEKGKYEDAMTFFDKAITIDPNYADAWHYKGWALSQQRRDDAIPVLDKAIALDPTNVNILGSKANALVQLQRNSEAIPVLEKAISINPNSYRLWAAIGHVYYWNCQFEKAVEAYRKALTLNPSDLDKKLLEDEITKIESRISLPYCSSTQPSGQQVTTQSPSNQNQVPRQTSTPLSVITLVGGVGLGGMVYLFCKKRL